MVVGLGNPGAEYAWTRHNIGFRVIDSLARTLGIKLKKKSKFAAVLGAGEFSNKKLILLKPWRFMNLSGQPVAAAVAFYKLDLDDLLVVTDDMALEPGKIRIRRRGSAGGHKGLEDIIEALATDNISRLRIGIGRSNGQDAVDFVLGEPSAAEKPLLDEAVERAQQAVLCWVENGIDAAMNRFN